MNGSFDPIAAIDALLDGSITPDQHAELDAWLAAEPANAATLVARTRLHRNLHAAIGSEQPAQPARTASADRTQQFQIARVTLALAAALLLSAAVVAIYVFVIDPQSAIQNPQSPAPIATLIDSTGTVIYENDIARSGGEYPSGAYAIDSGAAEFLLSNRVGIRLAGPTRLTLHDPMNATLSRGSATFDCPPGVVGYTVHLPDGVKVVDLGTRFHIDLSPDRSPWVYVTEGLVRIERPDHEAVVVRAGQRVAVDPDRADLPTVRSVNVDFDRDGSSPPAPNRASSARVLQGEVWNALVLGKLGPDEPRSVGAAELRDSDGRATTVAVELAQADGRWHVYRGTDHESDPVRTDSVYLSQTDNAPDDTIRWRITGLVPGAVYELTLLSQFQEGRAVHPTDFVVADGEPAKLNDDLHAVFAAGGPNPPIVADENGHIHGVMRRRPDQQFAAWTGLKLVGPIGTPDELNVDTPNKERANEPESETGPTSQGDESP